MPIAVTVDHINIHRVDDPATFLSLELDALSESSSRSGSIVVMAGGRRRSVFTDGHDTNLTVKCEQVSRADTDVVRAWADAGAFLFFRDPRGRIVWGHIMSPTIAEVDVVDMTDIDFTITEVTYSEAV